MNPRRPSRRHHDASPSVDLSDLNVWSDLDADGPDRRALGSLAAGRTPADEGDERWVAAADAALDADATREFWGEPPLRRPKRDRRAVVRADGSLQRTRSHRVVDPTDGRRTMSPPAPVERRKSAGAAPAIDPLLLRLGALVAVGVLLVPVVMAMRSAGDARDFGLRTMAAGEMAEWLPLPAIARTTPLEAATEVAHSVAVVVPATSESSETASESTATEITDTASTDTADTVVAESASPATSAPATTVAAPTCAIEYTVGAGDYWLRLADESGVALADLLRANSATVETPLYPGDEVCLPEGARRPSPPPVATAAASTAAAVESSGTDAPASTSPPATTAPSSTAPPATTTPTTVAPAVSRATPDEVRQIIREVWPEELHDKALDVANRESRFRADAYNGWCCYGVFQIHWSAHRSWLSTRGVTSATQLYDARTNAELAYEIYQRAGGWSPWSQTAY